MIMTLMQQEYNRSYCKTGKTPTHWILGRHDYEWLCGACQARVTTYQGMDIIEAADNWLIAVGVLVT
jgi:hypothetical protein